MKEETSIKEVIEEIKPFLNMEGGDVEFIKYDQNSHTVFVRLLGTCSMCMAQDETLKYGLLETIKEQVPEVEKIINVPL